MPAERPAAFVVEREPRGAGERIAYTCPGHSFYVHTFAREYDTLAGSFPGFETIGMSIDADGKPKDWLYSYHATYERKARRAHYIIARRLSRLYPEGVSDFVAHFQQEGT